MAITDKLDDILTKIVKGAKPVSKAAKKAAPKVRAAAIALSKAGKAKGRNQ